jgi:hypothetical protein
MIYCFDRIAQLLIEKIQREAEEKKKKRLAEESERKKTRVRDKKHLILNSR